MSLVVFLIIVACMITVLIAAGRYTSVEFVTHARLLFKTWSVWLASIGAALGAGFQAFPDAALHAWMILPPDIKSYLPPNILSFISPAIVVLAVLAQYVRQPKLKDKRDQLEGGNE